MCVNINKDVCKLSMETNVHSRGKGPGLGRKMLCGDHFAKVVGMKFANKMKSLLKNERLFVFKDLAIFLSSKKKAGSLYLGFAISN